MRLSTESSAVPRRRLVGLVAGPVLFTGILLFPIPGLRPQAHALAAVFTWTVVYWVTEALPLPVTALMSSVLSIVTGVAPSRQVLAPYADPIIFLFIGSFMLAEAAQASGLDRRAAFALLRYPWATRTPGRLLAAVGLIAWAISMWVSNTATTAMMLPIGLGILRAREAERVPMGPGWPVGLLLMLTWSSSVAVGIPIASPPNLIAIGMIRELTDRRLSFFDWVAVTMPLAVVMLGVCWFVLHFRYGRQIDRSQTMRTSAEKAIGRSGGWTHAEINVLAVFLLAATLWMLPGAVAMIQGPEAPIPRFFEAHLPESAVAIIAAVLLFVLPIDLRRGLFTLSWRQAAGIDWGTILLFGGGLSLGTLMFETELAQGIGMAIIRSGGENVWLLTAVTIILGILLSETSSNTASASIVVPIAIAAAQAGGMSPIPPALGAALGASFGFMLPVSTPPNAIVYGSGLVPMKEMIASGLWLDIAGAIIIWVGLRILCPILDMM